MDFLNYSIKNACIENFYAKSSFTIPNDTQCDVYSDIDFHDWDINNADLHNCAVYGTFQINNGTDCNFYTNVDFNNWTIENVQLSNVISINGIKTFSGSIPIYYKKGDTFYTGTITVRDGLITSAPTA